MTASVLMNGAMTRKKTVNAFEANNKFLLIAFDKLESGFIFFRL